ncbi:hypothetical protein [Glycomyces paridis]|uniref:DUF998 domain-containing protein n=1 Tax=Glycomyces paridis TaxID=2126555 RepID=A0A4S8P0T3_9ACTN|nr:hypothetical protein [Glycomyces paridis]THV23597.1 hypothetical protein E9998_22645 [Glycomyces paridis]
METTAPAAPLHRRLAAVLTLAVLAPVAAEYLTAYDSSTGNPLALAGGLLILAPLYGAPAVLIREAARRAGLGWGGVLALAAAFGIVQAGIWDQSLFSTGYRDIDYWEGMIGPTWIAPLGIAAATTLSFVGGHAVASFTAPIVLAEGLHPRLADRPWLRLPGLITTAVLYLAAAALILGSHLQTESDHASWVQIAGAVGVAATLAVLAFTLGRRRTEPVPRHIPPVWALVLVAMVAAGAFGWSYTWTGVAFTAALVIVCTALSVHWSRSESWGRRQPIALATGALLTWAAMGFLTEPLGEVATAAKYAHNTIAVTCVAALGWWALRRNR